MWRRNDPRITVTVRPGPSNSIALISTTTTGLGCRSGSYILHRITLTTIWLVLWLSSYLAHCAKVRRTHGDIPYSRFNSVNIVQGLATFLRQLSTFAAVCNTLCIILAGVFQFSNFYNTHHCNLSVLGRGV